MEQSLNFLLCSIFVQSKGITFLNDDRIILPQKSAVSERLDTRGGIHIREFLNKESDCGFMKKKLESSK